MHFDIQTTYEGKTHMIIISHFHENLSYARMRLVERNFNRRAICLRPVSSASTEHFDGRAIKVPRRLALRFIAAVLENASSDVARRVIILSFLLLLSLSKRVSTAVRKSPALRQRREISFGITARRQLCGLMSAFLRDEERRITRSFVPP